MTASYLHGVETSETTVGARVISVRKTAVIGLVGTAPMHLVDAANQNVNTLKLIGSFDDATKYFGPETSGYSIPAALRAIFKKGAGTVLVVNVFDPSVHFTAVAAEADTFVNGTFKLTNLPISGTLVIKDNTDATTYVENTDYTVDYTTGNVTLKTGGAIAAGATVHSSYNKPDPTKVLAADIIGTTTAGGSRTGMQAWQNGMVLFGFNPKVLIASSFCSLTGVAGALAGFAAQFKAVTLVDAPLGTSYDTALTGRGAEGTIDFDTSDPRTWLCYPYQQTFSSALNADVLEPYSQHLAGVIAATDENEGYWYSPSNHPMVDVDGFELPLTADFQDPSCQVNQLNAQGITTVYSAYGTGIRVWGNRSAAFPTSTDATTFMPVRRTADVIEDAIAFAQFQYIDKPLNQALIDQVVSDINGFLSGLKGKGAIIDGKAWADPADNPSAQLSAGQAVYRYDFMPPTAMERVTNKAAINTNYLTQLFGGKS